MKMSKSVLGWELHMKSSNYSTVTISAYIPTIKKVINFLGDPDASDVTVWDLESYLISLRDQGVSESTRQYHWKVIKSYFAWANKRKGLGIERPDTELEMPTVPEPEVMPYTEQEIKMLLKACKESEEAETHNRESYKFKRPTAARDQLLILFLLDTGVRVSELCRLQYKDINLNNHSAHIRAYETGKKSRDRVVYLGTKTMSLLWRLVTENEDSDDYIFCSSTAPRNKPLDRHAVDHLLKRLGAKAGIADCGAHRFRHTFAIQYLRNGGDIYTLKRQLGHSSLRMVQQYLQLSEQDSATAHRKASPVDNWI